MDWRGDYPLLSSSRRSYEDQPTDKFCLCRLWGGLWISNDLIIAHITSVLKSNSVFTVCCSLENVFRLPLMVAIIEQLTSWQSRVNLCPADRVQRPGSYPSWATCCQGDECILNRPAPHRYMCSSWSFPDAPGESKLREQCSRKLGKMPDASIRWICLSLMYFQV